MTLHGYSALLTVRRYTDDPTPALRASSLDGDGIVTIDPDDGRVSIAIPAEISGRWGWERGVYDVDLIPDGGDPATLRTGEVIVSAEVGR